MQVNTLYPHILELPEEKILSAGTSLDSEDIHSIIQLLYIVYSNTESWCKKALELATPYASLGDDEVLKLFSADATTRRPSLPPSILKEDFDPDCLGPTAEIVKCFNIAKAVFRILDIVCIGAASLSVYRYDFITLTLHL